MAKREFCQLWLTCANKAEADKIAKALLAKRFIACAKQMSVTSDFYWKNKVEHSSEVLLVMDSRLALFDKIELEVAKLQSYDTFVLEAVPITKISESAGEWLREETDV